MAGLAGLGWRKSRLAVGSLGVSVLDVVLSSDFIKEEENGPKGS